MLRAVYGRWVGSRRALVALLSMAILAACGGGGGGDGGTPSAPAQAGITGYVVKGPVGSATVNLYSITADGTRTQLATTTSDATGFYRFQVTPAAGMVILVEASGGNYNDEISATRIPLLGPLRAATVAPGAPLQVSLSPFSEAAVREIDSSSPKDWSAARVTGINTTFAGDTNFLQLKPVELSDDSVLESASADDVASAIFVGGFSGLLHRLGPSTPALFDQGLDAMRTMLADSYDDRYSPQWLRGTVDFINVTGLSASSKTTLKGLLVLQTGFASEAEITAALPTGVATGSASAAMPDDAFELVPDIGIVRESPVGSIFNKRGALMAYQLASSTNTYRYLYSGSVGELYGDGEMGIGRWHGGVVFDATDGRALDTLVNPQILSASNGRVYALGRPATGLPSCGIRVAPLVASTSPIQTAGTGLKPVVGLAPDSRLAVQYFGATANIGFDIGLQM